MRFWVWLLLLGSSRAQVLISGYCSCPSGNDPYADRTECQNAATALGKTYGGDLQYFRGFQQGPAGCWHHTSQDTVYWNPGSGASCQTVSASCVCVPGPTTTSSTATSVTSSSSTATSRTTTSSSQTSSSSSSSSRTSSSTSSSTKSSTVTNSTTTPTTSTTSSFSHTSTATSSSVTFSSNTISSSTRSQSSSVTSSSLSSISSTSISSSSVSSTTMSSSTVSSSSITTPVPTPSAVTSVAQAHVVSSSAPSTTSLSTSGALDENLTNTTEASLEWTTLQLSFAMAGCYSTDVLSWQGLIEISWVTRLPAMAFGGFMGFSLLMLFCLVCSSPPPLPLLELARGESARRTPPPSRKVLGGWSTWILHRCTLYIRCYKASLCERTLLLVQEGNLSKRQTWADQREEAALVANLRTQTVYILESFGSVNGGMMSRFRMLWPALQPWREVTYFSIYSTRLERAARLIFRLTLASALAVIFRQVLFGAFKRYGHEVCALRPGNLVEAMPVALGCCLAARLAWTPLYAGFMQQYRCRCLRWVAVTQGLLSSSVIVVLFLANTSDADGFWWLISFIGILVLDLGLLPFLATIFWVILSTMVLICNFRAVRLLREQLPPLHESKVPESSKARVTINSEPSVVEEPKSLLRSNSKENSKAQVGQQVLSVLPGGLPEEDSGQEPPRGRDALSVLKNWK